MPWHRLLFPCLLARRRVGGGADDGALASLPDACLLLQRRVGGGANNGAFALLIVHCSLV